MGSNVTQPSGISYFSLDTFSEILASVMIPYNRCASVPNIYPIRPVIQRNQPLYCSMKPVFNKRSGAVVMSPDSEGLGAADEAGLGSNLTQPSDISYFSLYTFSEVLASLMILDRNSL